MAGEVTPFASSGTCHPFASSAIGWQGYDQGATASFRPLIPPAVVPAAEACVLSRLESPLANALGFFGEGTGRPTHFSLRRSPAFKRFLCSVAG